MKKWTVTGRKHYSKAFEFEVEAETAHEASVVARRAIDADALATWQPEKVEYTDIVIVKEKK